MKNILLYKYATWALLALNLVVVSVFLFNARQHRMAPGGGFLHEAINMLDLDEQQQAVFKEYAHQHHLQMEAIHDQQQAALKSYFGQLTNPSDKFNSDSLLLQIQDFEKSKVDMTYRHFQEVESILRDNQKPAFKRYLDRAVALLILDDKAQSRR